MRNMSFMLTTEPSREKIKNVTRRNGWWFLEEMRLNKDLWIAVSR